MLSREQWIRRFGDALGAAKHRSPMPSERFARGKHLGEGMFGEVRSDSREPSVAVKRIDGRTNWGLDLDRPGDPLERRLGVFNEIDQQVAVGNQFNEFGEHVGIMPPLRSAEMTLMPKMDEEATVQEGRTYLEMPNLQKQGYRAIAAEADNASSAELNFMSTPSCVATVIDCVVSF